MNPLGILVIGGITLALLSRRSSRPSQPSPGSDAGSSTGPMGPEIDAIPSDDQRSYWEIFDLDENDQTIDLMASIIRSERYTGSVLEKRAIGWVARNLALEQDLPITDFLSPGRTTKEQLFSTTVPGGDPEKAIAKAILSSPQSYDPTGGASRLLDVDEIVREQRAGNPLTLEKARAALQSRGYVRAYTAGTIETYTLRK